MSTILQVDTDHVPGAAGVGIERSLLLIYDDGQSPHIVLPATELFEPSCFVLLPESGFGLEEHPFNAYNISYPYCRTAIRVRVDDVDPNPLLAEVVSHSRYLSIRVLAHVCDMPAPLSLFRVLRTEPAFAAEPCAINAVMHARSGQGFFIVDGSKVTFPLQALVELEAAGAHRLGWITVLPPGWFTP